jgi:Fe2+ or Zn2+ uptake regulation protein
MIYDQIRRNIPDISLGTVYRNLSFLADTGRIIRIRMRDGTLRFDARIREHYHWQCRVCGRVGDLTVRIDARLNEEAEEQSGVAVEGHDLCFIGICRSCVNIEADSPDSEEKKTESKEKEAVLTY